VDLDDSQLTYELRTEIDMGQVVLIGDYRRLGLGGNGTLPNDFSVNGVLFSEGDVVRADTAIKFMRGLFLWKLLPDSPLGLDVGLGLAGVDTRFGLRDVFSGTEASADELGLTPFLAGRAIYRLGDFELEGQASYIDGSFDLTDLHYLDLEVAGRWRFAGEVDGFSAWAELGYRETDLVVDFMNDPAQVDTDLGLSGPFAGLVIQF
ncbi:MAG: porin family protein, partial [Planctomycetota bacterium]